ncbi:MULTISPECIES: RbsD/FucU family protein [Pseudovibrio]|uniref:RbsD/FucU family protein n=1 Tax=Stappiaceae TaxID=2821832 RepID=UPI0023673ED5|nr:MULTISPECIES: RbsD/FucU domain-containing protein [Pseudovibrio]MDD7910568.1 RbsD/FucU domain-containing protein [Pseudovibrio exalbescens]MDX5594583.1 RbsD/FucU domain-containing protein [Pseudovibrio sp. SPO723]
MLKSIDPLLSADLLYALASMGHGDTLAIVDANFAAASRANGHLITMPGTTASDVLAAILTLFPVDGFDDCPIKLMAQADDAELPEAAQDFLKVLDASEEKGHKWEAIDRFAFYDLAEKTSLIVATTDLRPYGCLILQKGVVFDG